MSRRLNARGDQRVASRNRLNARGDQRVASRNRLNARRDVVRRCVFEQESVHADPGRNVTYSSR
jgi:hypothetical protein